MAACVEGLQKVLSILMYRMSRVSSAMCQNSEGAFSFTTSPLDVSMRDGTQIPSLIYSPKPRPWAAVVFAHGGCFSLGDRKSQNAICEMLASRGIAVIASSYRQGFCHPHPAALTDLTDIGSYAHKELWPELPLGIVGSSSGGWHALALTRPSKEPLFKFCVALCPVAHPGRRAAYLRSCINGTAKEDGFLVEHTVTKANYMLNLQIQYWQSDAAMHEAGETLLLPSNIPTLLVLGSADLNIPYQVTIGVQSWATKTIVIGGYGHSLQEVDPDDQMASFAPDLDRFIKNAVSSTSLTYPCVSQ